MWIMTSILSSTKTYVFPKIIHNLDLIIGSLFTPICGNNSGEKNRHGRISHPLPFYTQFSFFPWDCFFSAIYHLCIINVTFCRAKYPIQHKEGVHFFFFFSKWWAMWPLPMHPHKYPDLEKSVSGTSRKTNLWYIFFCNLCFGAIFQKS